MLIKGSLIRVLRGLFIAGEFVNLLEYGDLKWGIFLYTLSFIQPHKQALYEIHSSAGTACDGTRKLVTESTNTLCYRERFILFLNRL